MKDDEPFVPYGDEDFLDIFRPRGERYRLTREELLWGDINHGILWEIKDRGPQAEVTEKMIEALHRKGLRIDNLQRALYAAKCTHMPDDGGATVDLGIFKKFYPHAKGTRIPCSRCMRCDLGARLLDAMDEEIDLEETEKGNEYP